jgi:hypothetical protein
MLLATPGYWIFTASFVVFYSQVNLPYAAFSELAFEFMKYFVVFPRFV